MLKMNLSILELIDLLVKMSSSESNLDELKAKLDDVDSRIFNVQKKLSNAEKELSSDKYYDASNEIVDRNIKISLSKSIQKLNKVKNDINSELESEKELELSLHNELDEVRKEIESANKYNDVINKSSISSDSFNNMIASENKRISDLVCKKEALENKYNTVQKKVEYLAMSLSEINEKIDKENERLEEIDNNLNNIKSYVDTELKEHDENVYQEIKNELDDLLKEKENIINDPVYIAGEIKEYLAVQDNKEVENSFNKLINIVKEIPYMDLENENIDIEKNKLDEELRNYDAEISSKEYQTLDKEFIEERILYLKDDINKLRSEITEANDKQSKINLDNDILSAKIYKAEDQISKIDESLKDYENYNFDEGELPKSVVQASNNKLIEEKNNISEIAEKYREDLVSKLNDLNIYNEKIERLNQSLNKKEIELGELDKKLALNTKSKNILEEEKDRIRLENINKSILNLKYREEFNKSLSEIKNELEILLTSPIKKEETNVLEPSENINEIIVEDNKQEEVKTVEESKAEEEVLKEDVESKPLFEEFNIKDEKSNSDDKLRVIEVYDIPSDLKEKDNEDFIVNDFDDEDYVDLNTAITSMEDI